jgi:hypothetical protein
MMLQLARWSVSELSLFAVAAMGARALSRLLESQGLPKRGGNVIPASPVEEDRRRTCYVLVVGDEIDDAHSMAELVFGAMSGSVTPLLQTDWCTLQSHAAKADLLHFACHGRGQPYHLSYGAKASRRLLPAQAPQLGLRYGTVVFANACNSMAPRLLLAEFQSFGRSFYRKRPARDADRLIDVRLDQAAARRGSMRMFQGRNSATRFTG